MMLDFHHAIQYCLKEASISASQIDNVVFYEKPFVKFERLLETYLAFAPKGFTSFAKAMPCGLKTNFSKICTHQRTEINT